MRLLGLGPQAVATDAMRALWTDHATLQTMLDVEAALARAGAEAGVVPPEAVPAIADACRAGLYDMDAIATGALRAGTPTIPVVAALTRQVRAADPAAAGWVHFGATSQDIADTALVLQLRRAVALVCQDAAPLLHALRALAERHAATPMLGRTLLQPGPPVTFGLKAAGWFAALQRGLDRLRAAADEALVLQFGGAVGTLAGLGADGMAVAEALAQVLDLKLPAAPWHTQRDRLAALASAAVVLGGSLGKIARDTGLMMQAEVMEVAEPGGAGRGGSSTMPHKRNPVASTVTLAVANRLPGLLAGLLAGMVQEHERATGGWQAEAAAQADIFLLLSGAVASQAEAIGGLRVDAAAMGDNIGRLRGLVLAERLLLRLAPVLGRDEAHGLVERLVAGAAAAGTTLRDVAAESPEVQAALGPGFGAALDALFDPAGYTGSAGTFIRRQLDGI
jgi:3-carboxy-cis,cis-muconate cycloisomerase